MEKLEGTDKEKEKGEEGRGSQKIRKVKEDREELKKEKRRKKWREGDLFSIVARAQTRKSTANGKTGRDRQGKRKRWRRGWKRWKKATEERIVNNRGRSRRQKPWAGSNLKNHLQNRKKQTCSLTKFTISAKESQKRRKTSRNEGRFCGPEPWTTLGTNS